MIERDAEDLYGRAIQHETDHLSGKLFIDYLDPLTRHTLAPKLREFEVEFRKCQRGGGIGADDDLLKQLDTMQRPVAVAINWAAGV